MLVKRIAAFTVAVMYAIGTCYIQPVRADEAIFEPPAIVESYSDVVDIDEDLIEIEDDNWGYSDIEHERKIYIDMANMDTLHYGDEIVLTAILVDFDPEDKLIFIWQYSDDEGDTWYTMIDQADQIYKFILTKDNVDRLYRVQVLLTE